MTKDIQVQADFKSQESRSGKCQTAVIPVPVCSSAVQATCVTVQDGRWQEWGHQFLKRTQQPLILSMAVSGQHAETSAETVFDRELGIKLEPLWSEEDMNADYNFCHMEPFSLQVAKTEVEYGSSTRDKSVSKSSHSQTGSEDACLEADGMDEGDTAEEKLLTEQTHLGSLQDCQKKKRNRKATKSKKTYMCDQCDAVFTRSDCLTRHIRIHRSDRPFVCSVCSSCFKDPNNLKQHQRTHSVEKRFTCEFCGTAFKSSRDLRRHIRAHTGEKSFTCEACGACFTRSDALKSHRKKHTGEMPYRCKVCLTSFRYLNVFKEHVMKCHTDESLVTYEKNIVGSAYAVSENVISSSPGAAVLHLLKNSPNCKLRETHPSREAVSDLEDGAHFAKRNSSDSEQHVGELVPEKGKGPSASQYSDVKTAGRPTVDTSGQAACGTLSSTVLNENAYKCKVAKTMPLQWWEREEQTVQSSWSSVGIDCPGAARDVETWAPSQDTEDFTTAHNSCGTEKKQLGANKKWRADSYRSSLCMPAAGKGSASQGRSLGESVTSTLVLQGQSADHFLDVKGKQIDSENTAAARAKGSSFEELSSETEGKPDVLICLKQDPGDISDYMSTFDSDSYHSDSRKTEVTIKAEYGQVEVTNEVFFGGLNHESGVGFSDRFGCEDKKLMPQSDSQVLGNEDEGACASDADANVYIDIADDTQEEMVGCQDTLITSGNSDFKLCQKASSDKGHMCQVCGKVFKRSECLKRHLVVHSTERPFKCDVCGSSFKDRGNLKTHQKVHTGERPFPCELCSASFKLSRDLKRHVATHTGLKPFVCQECGTGFARSESLKVHQQKHSEEKPFVCQCCDARFKYMRSLKDHINAQHSDGKVYSCRKCDATFLGFRYLQQHKKKHAMEKPTVCDQCGACFPKPSKLIPHMRKHTGEKPFSCETCGAAFATNGGLKKHIRCHTNERPFICKICSAAFRQGSALTQHMRTHTGERPYACVICEASFKQSGNLKTHMLKHIRSNKTSST